MQGCLGKGEAVFVDFFSFFVIFFTFFTICNCCKLFFYCSRFTICYFLLRFFIACNFHKLFCIVQKGQGIVLLYLFIVQGEGVCLDFYFFILLLLRERGGDKFMFFPPSFDTSGYP